ncbi:MAG: helix-turn-helix domain-containing protein, partial [Bacteroides sp.]|nr:helix-turn-helix domain-containing protein [Bacteroides sp.]
MPDLNFRENDFLSKISEIIEENLSNEQFGVSELAGKMGMSRSNLLRKIKKLTSLSVSQYISQVRLAAAMELLKEQSYTVSEVSYKVGFSSTSYFIKCFREHYGHPPGEVGKRTVEEPAPGRVKRVLKKRHVLMAGAACILIAAALLFFVGKPGQALQSGKMKGAKGEKSIAVLPFKNDSNDSTNIYIINGLMESVLNDLQKIEDLKVISRTSVEKYRYTSLSIPEMARELKVRYFVEGSGQKIGDQILLNIQLIEAETDRHLWAEQYSREATDIFALQKEVSKKIANEIEAIITPEEEERIDQLPTEDLVAYDYFLRGQDLFFRGSREGVVESIPWFQKAVKQDPEFAHAYADIAIAYYVLDMLLSEKIYADSINHYADKALLFDAHLPQSLIAKAFYYMSMGAYEKALPHLEKALEYNPNSALVLNTLSDFYASFMPNTNKYLEYALKGVELDIAAHDSVEASYILLHVSNALIQSGFVDEALEYIGLSLDYNPENLYAEQVKAYILYAKNGDLSETRDHLIETLQRDLSRLDVLQEVGKIYYYQRDYERSWVYYKKFLEMKEAYDLDIYRGEDIKIAVVCSELG